MRYKTLTHSLEHELDKLVERMLGDGWELYGNPYHGSGMFCQVVIKPLAGLNFKTEKVNVLEAILSDN